MGIKHRAIFALFFWATFLAMSLGPQSAAADPAFLNQLAVDGHQLCVAATNVPQAVRDACSEDNTLMDDFATTYPTSYPTLYGLSQVIASTLDIGWQHVSGALRQTYADDILQAVKQYSRYHQGDPAPCVAGARNWTYAPSPFACAGLGTGAYPASNGTAAYDDNAWIGTDLINAYHWTCNDPSQPASLSNPCDTALLGAAEGVLNFLETGLWSNADNQCPANVGRCKSDGTLPTAYQGGLFFDTTRYARPTVPNADAALFASELASADWNFYHSGLDDPYPLGFANKEYQWVRSVLGETSQGGSDPFPHGLFWNHIKPDGCFTDKKVADPSGCGANDGDPVQSYGVGLMIGTATNFSSNPPAGATDNFLNEAEIYAAVGNSDYFTNGDTAPGNPASESDYKELEAQCPAYNAVYFHYLFVLNNVTGSQAWNTLEPGYYSWVSSPPNYNNGDYIPPWAFLGNMAGCGDNVPGRQEWLLPEAGATRAVIDHALPGIQSG